MFPFAYERVDSARAAVAAMSSGRAEKNDTQFLAGGTTLVDLMRLGVMQPNRLVDINALAQTALGRIESGSQGLRLGALAHMAQAAEHPDIRRDYPVIAQSLTLAASPQLRNMATLGGNVLQRTRCGYFRDVSYANCNKRIPGSGCAALDGFNRRHAVLGVSNACIATYAGDFAQALIALDASIEVSGRQGDRKLRFAELHRPPADRPDRETTLSAGEIITAFVIPPTPWARRSLYLKVRDRESYEFALASAAVALDLDADRKVREARVALGGVATVPWRATTAEASLKGKAIDADAVTAAADAAFADAETYQHNAYKVALGKRTLSRALLQAAAMEV